MAWYVDERYEVVKEFGRKAMMEEKRKQIYEKSFVYVKNKKKTEK